MGSSTTQNELKVTSLKVDPQKWDAFKALAASNRRTASQHLNWLIDRALEQES